MGLQNQYEFPKLFNPIKLPLVDKVKFDKLEKHKQDLTEKLRIFFAQEKKFETYHEERAYLWESLRPFILGYLDNVEGKNTYITSSVFEVLSNDPFLNKNHKTISLDDLKKLIFDEKLLNSDKNPNLRFYLLLLLLRSEYQHLPDPKPPIDYKKIVNHCIGVVTHIGGEYALNGPLDKKNSLSMKYFGVANTLNSLLSHQNRDLFGNDPALATLEKKINTKVAFGWILDVDILTLDMLEQLSLLDLSKPEDRLTLQTRLLDKIYSNDTIHNFTTKGLVPFDLCMDTFSDCVNEYTQLISQNLHSIPAIFTLIVTLRNKFMSGTTYDWYIDLAQHFWGTYSKTSAIEVYRGAFDHAQDINDLGDFVLNQTSGTSTKDPQKEYMRDAQNHRINMPLALALESKSVIVKWKDLSPVDQKKYEELRNKYYRSVDYKLPNNLNLDQNSDKGLTQGHVDIVEAMYRAVLSPTDTIDQAVYKNFITFISQNYAISKSNITADKIAYIDRLCTRILSLLKTRQVASENTFNPAKSIFKRQPDHYVNIGLLQFASKIKVLTKTKDVLSELAKIVLNSSPAGKLIRLSWPHDNIETLVKSYPEFRFLKWETSDPRQNLTIINSLIYTCQKYVEEVIDNAKKRGSTIKDLDQILVSKAGLFNKYIAALDSMGIFSTALHQDAVRYIDEMRKFDVYNSSPKSNVSDKQAGFYKNKKPLLIEHLREKRKALLTKKELLRIINSNYFKEAVKTCYNLEHPAKFKQLLDANGSPAVIYLPMGRAMDAGECPIFNPEEEFIPIAFIQDRTKNRWVFCYEEGMNIANNGYYCYIDPFIRELEK